MATSLKTIICVKYQVIYSECAILTSKNKHVRNGEFTCKGTIILIYSGAECEL